MRAPMEEKVFFQFYYNTITACSKETQNLLCKYLENANLIKFGKQTTLFDNDNVLYFENKKDIDRVIEITSHKPECSSTYEMFEFKKLYKYSVPFFYSLAQYDELKIKLENSNLKNVSEENYFPDYILGNTIKDAHPSYIFDDDAVMIKFVLQKTYRDSDTYEPVDYRYSIVIYFHKDGFLEIRYDTIKFGGAETNVNSNTYANMVTECVSWLKENFELTLYSCNHGGFIDVVKSKANHEVIIYKQMMELNTGGSAELTASQNEDYILPFIGELRELIKDNEDVFSQNSDIKKLLTDYLDEKEITANYPYIYIKWIKPVESDSYIIKVTFDYLNNKYTLMQHNTGICKNLEMRRMNDAIKYLCTKCAFNKGEEI